MKHVTLRLDIHIHIVTHTHTHMHTAIACQIAAVWFGACILPDLCGISRCNLQQRLLQVGIKKTRWRRMTKRQRALRNWYATISTDTQTDTHRQPHTDRHTHSQTTTYRQSGLRTMQLAWTFENNEFNMVQPANGKCEIGRPTWATLRWLLILQLGVGKWAWQESNNSLQHMFTGVSLQRTHTRIRLCQ